MNAPHIRIQSSTLAASLKPLLEGKRSGKDIITRSVLLVPREESIGLYSTDGVAFMRAGIPAQVINFPRSVIFDPSGLLAMMKSGDDTVTLFLRDGQLYGEFFGGEIFIPTLGFPEKLFKGSPPGRPNAEFQANKEQYLSALTALHRVTESTDIPDLCFVFMTSSGAFASNGSVVAKVSGKFFEGTLRRRDAALLEMILEGCPDETFKIGIHATQIVVETSAYFCIFPLPSRILPESYRGRAGATEDYFSISPPRTKKILTALVNALGHTGALLLSFGDTLRGEVRTQRGRSSEFELASARTGQATTLRAQTLIRRLQVALSVFPEEDQISMGAREDGSILMWAGSRSLAVLSRAGG